MRQMLIELGLLGLKVPETLSPGSLLDFPAAENGDCKSYWKCGYQVMAHTTTGLYVFRNFEIE